ncbi:MAG: 30S ribosome-binding factor RbfA [Coriobacteriia bacterium]|nr:30S ribosome-binding factor RbfA [Coriobacteriia bacterium]
MKQNETSHRLGEIAREKIASILMFEISDPRLDMVTVTECEVSLDRSVCHVYVSAEEERYDEVLAGLESAKGRIRSILGKNLKWRVTPELFFHIDKSADEAERIAKSLLNRPESLDVEKDESGYPIEPSEED